MNFSGVKHLFKESIKPDNIRYVINVTIESAKGFDGCSNIYIRYWTDLPEGWQMTQDSPIHGYTHQSRVSYDFPNHFGHCFTLDISTIWQSDRDCLLLPQLFFEVIDVNLWGRQKSVGYGFTNLRLDPKYRTEIVSTWRPQLASVASHMREHFLGLAPQIEDISYAGVPNHDGVLARFPFKTITSGTVNLRFDTIMQKGTDILAMQQTQRIATGTQRVVAMSTAVDEVIQAYHRAKQRLKAAHESLVQ